MSAHDSTIAPLRRLARVVQELLPELSFTRAKRAVTEGQVLLGGVICRDPGALVPAGAEVRWDRDRPADRTPIELRIELLHADDDVAVVVKPAGLLSIPTPEREKDTLLSRLALAINRRRGERPFLAVVQRLDRDTSGLVVFATSRRGQASLSHQLLDRTMSRVYDAIVEGEIRGEAGTIDAALIGDGIRRRRWVVRPGERGKPSVTHWRVVERLAGATRLRVSLETGRTHQIRIHLASIGYPVVGEPVYRAGEEEELKISFPRQALHAGELAFRHPADGREMRFQTPPPEDFEQLLTRLRRGRRRS
jgi:23S rRNA pseudouridine1911/1915/1917 synthase